MEPSQKPFQGLRKKRPEAMDIADDSGSAQAASLQHKSVGARMARVAEIAGKAADAVDRDARFPHEAVEALKREALLGVAVPVELGGEGLGVAAIADLVAQLAQACGSASMIYGMHQIQISSFASHGVGSPWHREYMRRIASEQFLLASATSEAGIGGNLRNSICAINITDGEFSLTKDATVISYGAHADAILATARRGANAASTDQVLVVVPKNGVTLERTSAWDTLGMRGTCSDGFMLKASGGADQVFPKPFSEIAAQSMLASSHIFWAATWFGMAANAYSRARTFVRQAARKQPNIVPPGALRLSEAATKLQEMKGLLLASMHRFEAAQRDEDDLSSMGFTAEINSLKIAASQKAAEVVQLAMLITGILGYKNGTPFSVGRHMRDVASAAVMISNDRIHANTSTLLLMSRFDVSLRG